jgi:hypothetical protein
MMKNASTVGYPLTLLFRTIAELVLSVSVSLSVGVQNLEVFCTVFVGT